MVLEMSGHRGLSIALTATSAAGVGALDSAAALKAPPRAGNTNRLRQLQNDLETLAQSGALLAKEAGILGQTLEQVEQLSVRDLERGRFGDAWGDMLQAVSKVEEEMDSANRVAGVKVKMAAKRICGILLVFLLIGACWSFELLRAQRVEDEKQKAAPFFHALSFIRYIMAWLLVACNFYGKGQPPEFFVGGVLDKVAQWGELAIPWFFFVSGFGHSYSQVVSPNPDKQEDWFYAMVRRAATWYPLFAISLTFCALRLGSVEAEDWSHYVACLLLVNGIIWDRTGFPFLTGDFWLSYLVFYLMAWGPMHQVLMNSTNSVIWTLFTISFLILFPSAIMEWYFFEDWTIFVMVQYWPTFVSGQGLAIWFVRNCMICRPGSRVDSVSADIWDVKPAQELPRLLRSGATQSLLALGLIMFIISPHDKLPLLRQPVAPLVLKGGLLPLFGVLVAALACEVDPVARFLSRAPFRWTSKLAFTTFIFQVPVHQFVRDRTGWTGLTWTFSSSLLVVSALGYALLERPWRLLFGVSDR